MVCETRMHPSSLIYPMFVAENEKTKSEISAMPGQYRYSLDPVSYTHLTLPTKA